MNTWVSIAPAEAEHAPFGPYDAVIRLGGEHTGGTLAVVDYHAGPGAGPEDHHAQTREDVAVLLIEGEVDFAVGGESVAAAPGHAFFVPRGVPFSRGRIRTDTARYLLISAPAGLDAFFRDAADALGALPAGSGPAEVVAAGTAVRERYGIVSAPEVAR